MARSSSPAAGAGAARSLWVTGRCVRARTLPPAPHGLLRRRIERETPIFQWKSGPAHAETFPGDRLGLSRQRAPPAPGRGRRCPVALGHRVVRFVTVRDGRGDGPCRPRRRQSFTERRVERKRLIFQWKSSPAHVGTPPRNRRSPAQQRAAPAPREGQVLPGRFGRPGGACEHAPYRWARTVFADAGLSGNSRSSGGRAAPLTWERCPVTASHPHNRGRRLPRMARSASPPEGQALPGRFGQPGGSSGTVAWRQGHLPLPTGAARSLPATLGCAGQAVLPVEARRRRSADQRGPRLTRAGPVRNGRATSPAG